VLAVIEENLENPVGKQYHRRDAAMAGLSDVSGCGEMLIRFSLACTRTATSL
jgi:hypothetical protein